MNDGPSSTLQEFLDRHLPLPGVAAWAARFPDRTMANLCYSDWFVPQQVEQILNRLALATDNLTQHGLQPVRLCWTFEHARIYLALRSDASSLALFVENRPGAPTDGVDALLEEFNAMQP